MRKEYIYNGEWADGEYLADGRLYNGFDVDQFVWDSYQEECQEEGVEATDEGFDLWFKEHGESERESAIYCMDWECSYLPDDTVLDILLDIKMNRSVNDYNARPDELEWIREYAESHPLPEDYWDGIWGGYGYDRKLAEAYRDWRRS